MSKYIWSDQDLAKLKQLILERDKIVISLTRDPMEMPSEVLWLGQVSFARLIPELRCMSSAPTP